MSKHGLGHKVMTALLVILGLYVAFVAIVFIFQSHLVFFPQRRIHSTPHEIGLAYDAIDFVARDGVRLSGWFITAKKPGAVVLFCHGNAGNISDRLQLIKLLHKLDLSTFIFDYRGYGQSEGSPSEQGTYLDAEAAWDYLTLERGVPQESIIVFGMSLGGAVAAQLAQDHKPAALIIESAFTSLPDMAAEHYPFLPARLLTRFRYPTLDYLRQVACPVLIVHSNEDEIVPYSQGCRLYEAANDPKDFLEIRGDHNTGALMSAETYMAGLNQFITKFIGVKSARQ